LDFLDLWKTGKLRGTSLGAKIKERYSKDRTMNEIPSLKWWIVVLVEYGRWDDGPFYGSTEVVEAKNAIEAEHNAVGKRIRKAR
jgi:hypothetical protein